MHVLVLHAHPVPSSYSAALYREAVEGLTSAGHSVDQCNLYEDGFDPVMSYEDRIGYYEIPGNRESVDTHVKRLRSADGLVIVSPVWTLGFPAILKGYFDRVWIPGVAFSLDENGINPRLTNIRKLAAVMTYGSSRFQTMLAGDPPRRVVNRLLRSQIKPFAPVRYLAKYNLDRSTEQDRTHFLRKVRTDLSKF
jgi:NAD(P)H dehydrogenase (quinone)